jgi:hypothetical protein
MTPIGQSKIRGLNPIRHESHGFGTRFGKGKRGGRPSGAALGVLGKGRRLGNGGGFGIEIIEGAQALIQVRRWRGLRRAGQFQDHAQTAMGTVDDMPPHLQRELNVFRTTGTGNLYKSSFAHARFNMYETRFWHKLFPPPGSCPISLCG